MAAQGIGLADRLVARCTSELPSVPVWRLFTDGPAADVRAAVEGALQEALSIRR